MDNRNNINIATNIIATLIIAVSVLAIYTPSVPWLRTLSEYNVQMVFVLFGLGILFLIVDQIKLLGVSFVCCAMLCVFLKSASYDTLVFPKPNTSQQLIVSQINMSSVNDNYEDLVETLLIEQPDIISFQEVTPDWNRFLKEDFSKDYPFSKSLVRIDPYGLAIYSKIPLENIDTFRTAHIPHLICNIVLNGKKINLISSYITPSLNKKTSTLAKAQLDRISREISRKPNAVLVLGDYNMVHWTPEMMAFKEESHLSNSRRESSANPSELPYEHILFTKELECVSFKNLKGKPNNYLGIFGSYQYKSVENAFDMKLSSASIY